MPTEHSIPRWTIWSVLTGIVVTVAVTFAVDAVTADATLDTSDLGQYLLQETDGPDDLARVAEFESVDLGLDPQSGAESGASAILSDADSEPVSSADAVRDWSPGHRVVVSEVLVFESESDAADFVDGVWSDFARGALERQRGPDDSLLMFHPEFERGGGARIGPVAVAAWAVDSTVLMVTHIGADAAADVLEFARVVEDRRSENGA